MFGGEREAAMRARFHVIRMPQDVKVYEVEEGSTVHEGEHDDEVAPNIFDEIDESEEDVFCNIRNDNFLTDTLSADSNSSNSTVYYSAAI